MRDAELRRQVARLAQELARTQDEVRTLRRGARTPQLAHSSLEQGQALEVRDEAGVTRLRLGYQPDGTVTTTVDGGDPPPAPSAPTVVPMASGLLVSWDGLLADPDDPLPADFDHVNVHVSTTDGFTPDESTFVVSIPRSAGSVPIAPLAVGVTYYVVLVPVGTGGVQGAPSAQASGAPEAVTDIAPGSITETEIADDAISTPKLRAEAVTALKIAAEAIEAGHIQAAAVTASKLEADLVLGTRIIAGTPGGARVELDPTGLKGYDASDALVFAIDSAGNALFTGDIVGSEITGSRMVIGSAPGNVGTIEDASGTVRTRVTTSDGQRAQIAATTGQAEFTAWADAADPMTPVGGMIAQDGLVALTMQSVIGDATEPYVQLTAASGQAVGLWRASSGSAVQLRALPGSAQILLTAPDAVDPDDAQGAGHLFAQRHASDIASVSVQGPVWAAATGPEQGLRAMLHLEGARPERAYTRSIYSARRHVLQGEWDGTGIDTTTHGVVDLADTHSIRANRHAPVRGELAGSLTSFSTGSSFHDFPSGVFDPFGFQTGWSGRVRVTVMMSGLNSASDASSIALGYRLSGASTVAASLMRCAFVRSIGAGSGSSRQSCQVVYMNLTANASYTLTPTYRITSGSTAFFDTALDNSITVEPLT